MAGGALEGDKRGHDGPRALALGLHARLKVVDGGYEGLEARGERLQPRVPRAAAHARAQHARHVALRSELGGVQRAAQRHE